MEVSNALIERLLELAKLEFAKEEKENIMADLKKIIEMIEKLEEVDLDGIEPLKYVSDIKNNLRNDEIEGMASKTDALKNAPLADSDYFKVPKVLSK